MTIIRNLIVLLMIAGFGSDLTAQTAPSPKKSKIVLKSSLDRLSLEAPKTTPQVKQRKVFSVESLPIFCKIEHKLAKSSKVNVMMRLGSLDYVNKLEGKGN